MRALLQRVTRADVRIDDEEVARIGPGLLVLLGVYRTDAEANALRLADKVLAARIFPGEGEEADKPMHRSVLDVGGDILVVSQFTLAADTRKGNRPSFTPAAPPDIAEPLYERFVTALRTKADLVATGRFGADMQVGLVNDGPVTLLLDV